MRMMLKVSVPVEAGNRTVREGALQKTMLGFVDQAKPEAAYFFADQGKRTALFVFDLKDAATIPSLCEPFFMRLDASIELQPTMNVEDLKTGLDRIGKM